MLAVSPVIFLGFEVERRTRQFGVALEDSDQVTGVHSDAHVGLRSLLIRQIGGTDLREDREQFLRSARSKDHVAGMAREAAIAAGIPFASLDYLVSERCHPLRKSHDRMCSSRTVVRQSTPVCYGDADRNDDCEQSSDSGYRFPHCRIAHLNRDFHSPMIAQSAVCSKSEDIWQ